MSNYSVVRDGINAVLATVGSLTTATVLAYEPKSVQVQVMLYTIPQTGTLGMTKVAGTAAPSAWTYTMRHRLLVPWQDETRADEILAPYLDSIPAAINDDPWLGTVYTDNSLSGGSFIDSWQAHDDLVVIDGIEFRYVDFYSTSIVKSVG